MWRENGEMVTLLEGPETRQTISSQADALNTLEERRAEEGEVLDQVVNREQTSPTLFSHSVFNAASGYVARIFQLHGCALGLVL